MLPRTIRTVHTLANPCPEYVGKSGLTYSFKELIQQRPHTGSVWVANAENRRYLLKDIPESYYQNFTEDIWPRLQQHPNIRLPCDIVPNQNVLVYNYLIHDFLALARGKIGPRSRKQILKSVLRGLAEFHKKDIIHLDVKPDNIVIESHPNNDEMIVLDTVQLADFENAAWLEPGKNIEGMLAGNDNWRSPEAHLRAKLNKPTDMFSFGVVCICAMLGRVIFGHDRDFEYHESQGIIPPLIRLQRQISYFGDETGFQGLRHHLSHNEAVCEILDAMWSDRDAPYIPYKHFSTWPEVKDENFKDVVLKLMSLDPKSRITAREALQHPWFVEVEAI